MQNNTQTLKIYGDKISQPVRSVLLFCELNKIPYNFIPINILKGEQHTNEELQKVNPSKKMPAISYSDNTGKTFNLAESCSILRFLSEIYKVDEKWYPRNDIYRRSLIDQHMDWHHSNTRHIFSGAIVKKMMVPKMLKLGGEFAEKAKLFVDTSSQIPILLKKFDEIFSERKFIVDDQISIADLIFSCEVYQIKILGYDLTQYPNLWKYLCRINETPEAMKINDTLEKLDASLKKRNAKF